MQQKINIAIDGHSSCGKSTTSRLVARKLGYKYIDTGAMYRAVTWYFLDREVNIADSGAVEEALRELRLDFQPDAREGSGVLVNGRPADEALRSMAVSENVSAVSAVSAVRRKLVELQREIARSKGVVMDGRDIGSVVLPDAELKIFMTASADIRAQRRWKELTARGVEVSLDEIRANLELRDHLDSTRADSPLVRAADALLLDTSHMTIEGQVDWIYRLAMERANA